MAAAMTSAQVYWMEWWWRHVELHRRSAGSTPARPGSAGRDSKAQVSQETSPAWAAVSGIARRSSIVNSFPFANSLTVSRHGCRASRSFLRTKGRRTPGSDVKHLIPVRCPCRALRSMRSLRRLRFESYLVQRRRAMLPRRRRIAAALRLRPTQPAARPRADGRWP